MITGLDERLGIAILERPLLRILATLWEGPVASEHLDAIEKAIRAFLISPTLVASRLSGSVWGDHPEPSRKAIYYEEPFGDHCLDYEFVHPQKPHPYSEVEGTESDFLTSLVTNALKVRALKALPTWIEEQGEAFAFLDAWYEGYPVRECELSAELMFEHEDDHEVIKRSESLFIHPLFHFGPALHARYLVGCHRAGLIVYGNSPLTEICASHIFSKWPDYLLKTLGEDFKRATDELRGPGIGLMLPPLTSLVLSHATHRDSIPTTLRDLRDEYLEPRKKLWDMLSEMWFAPTFEKQIKILKKLRAAADSILPSAFSERFDALSLGISTSDVLSGSVSPLLSNVRQQFEPTTKVKAVSFAGKLAKDLRRHLLSSRDILKRHFTRAELAEFGVD